jgi:hypothetical protein
LLLGNVAQPNAKTQTLKKRPTSCSRVLVGEYRLQLDVNQLTKRMAMTSACGEQDFGFFRAMSFDLCITLRLTGATCLRSAERRIAWN